MQILPHKVLESKVEGHGSNRRKGIRRRIEVTVERETVTVVQRRRRNQAERESPEEREEAMVRLEALLDGAGDLPDGGTRGCCACGEGNIVSRYRYMTSRSMNADSDSLLMTLAEFRFELRRFLHFSEGAAVAAGLHAKQHQLLLQVAGAPKGTAVTIAYAAERLGLKHNSAVELANRSENEGLLTRTADPTDGRKAILRLTLKGRLILDRLSDDHAQELNERAPRLMKALQQVKKHAQVETSAGAR